MLMGLHDTCVSRSGVGGSWSTDTLMAMIIYTILNTYIYIYIYSVGFWFLVPFSKNQQNGKQKARLTGGVAGSRSGAGRAGEEPAAAGRAR